MQPHSNNEGNSGHERPSSSAGVAGRDRTRRRPSSQSHNTGRATNVTRLTNGGVGSPIQRRQQTTSPPNLAPTSGNRGASDQEERDRYFLSASGRFPKSGENAPGNRKRRTPTGAQRRGSNKSRSGLHDHSRSDEGGASIHMTDADMRAMSSMDPKRIERQQQEVCFANIPRCFGQAQNEEASAEPEERRSSSRELNGQSPEEGAQESSDFGNDVGGAPSESIVQPHPLRPVSMSATGNSESAEVEDEARRVLAARISEWQRQHSLPTSDVATVLRQVADRWNESDAQNQFDSCDGSTFDNFVCGLNDALGGSFAENYRRMSLASVSSRKLQEISGKNDEEVELSGGDSDPAFPSDYYDENSVAPAISDSIGRDGPCTPEAERSLHGGAEAPIKELEGNIDECDSDMSMDTIESTLEESADFEGDEPSSSLEPPVRYRLYPADMVKGLIYSDDNVTQPRSESNRVRDVTPAEDKTLEKTRHRSAEPTRQRGSSRGALKGKVSTSLFQSSKRSTGTKASKAPKKNIQWKKKTKEVPREELSAATPRVRPQGASTRSKRVAKRPASGKKRPDASRGTASRDHIGTSRASALNSVNDQVLPNTEHTVEDSQRIVDLSKSDLWLSMGRKSSNLVDNDGRTVEYMHSVERQSDVLSACPSEVSNKCSLSSDHRVEGKKASSLNLSLPVENCEQSPSASVNLSSPRSRSSAFSRQCSNSNVEQLQVNG
eukprot:gb/GECG01006467.1/.p1 GENE.gb/GECG01006467.1/~~gb/GECG01006467.1/.p1  ORF type:complete len:722 (+),score=95.89 gb/GECG01006467.1/:1-2166(+)